MRQLFFILLIIHSCTAFGQYCQLNLSGQITDEFTGDPLAFANVLIEETGTGAVTDSTGFFAVGDLCLAGYHMRISHIGCEPERIYISLKKDTMLSIELHHHAEFLEEVLVKGKNQGRDIQSGKVIAAEEISKANGKSLSEITETITGVSTLKNGSGIAKPVIHGLYGNRITLLNNGVPQAGQQWGNDHAPEIDPNVAQRIKVVKGVGALAYGGKGLGGIVLVSPGPIKVDPHLHGGVNYTFASNGLGHTLSSRIQKSGQLVNWRLVGTLKKIGDRHSPDYFLTNTGNQEADIALQLEKNFNDRLFTSFYYSLYSAEIGVLRGAHIGNLTDLRSALDREVPFFTADTFSYKINAPRQVINHHLVKGEIKYYYNETDFLNISYAFQHNRRKEFDVRRGGRTDRAALDLSLFSNFLDVQYQLNKEDHIFKFGWQSRFDENDNVPGTGVLPLIPNYELYNSGLFAFWTFRKNDWKTEVGGRYDFNFFQVAAISSDLPRRFIDFSHTYHNYAASAGIKYKSHHWTSRINLGIRQRPPEVNELYSQGLHQGVAGIEEGDRNLVPEQSIKLTAGVTYTPSEKLLMESTIYFQEINDFIYLQPQDQFRLTIRGAFPVFKYRQTNARLYGLDFLLKYEPTPHWEWITQYAYLKGINRSVDQPLILMPANNLSTAINYRPDDMGSFSENRIGLKFRYVFEQKNIPMEQDFQDFAPPPPAYYLLALQLETTRKIGDQSLRFSLQVDNLLNTRYRDYLDRLRYFSDAAGRNIRLGVRWSF